ncbi:Oxysterol-binding protein 3 [Cytospora paraplurivora]|uniref:Oxysterol-binding protein 3 n=1 Tax=Cytospora paraplurivora TaxID=2898453 RepID=A0AAN9YJG7_9PEZI
MAGIEQLEIHSKSYIVRWVNVNEGHTISWSLQPHKKSINFGIVKHPGNNGSSTGLAPSQLDDATEQLDGTSESGKRAVFAKSSGNAQEQLIKKGFNVVEWHGKCEADKVSTGTFDVGSGDGGMFGLIFDNTFSKQTSKTATFVLLTYPTGAPPQTARVLPNLQAAPPATNDSQTSFPNKNGPSPSAAQSVDSLQSQKTRARATSVARSEAAGSTTTSGNYHTGTLLKRRRKKGQGFARRFFSLDFATCTLSYYHDRNSSALRGAIPLSLAAIAADESRGEISIDSGAEIWHLKTTNERDFKGWAEALEKASRIARGLDSTLLEPLPIKRQVTRLSMKPAPNNPVEEDREWQQVEALVSRVVGTRDALRRLVRDTASQKQTQPPPQSYRPPSSHLSPSTPTVAEEGDYFSNPQDRRPFWKRKSSASITPGLQNSVAAALAVPSPGSAGSGVNPSGTSREERRRSRPTVGPESTIGEHCNALLSDLDAVVMEFSTLLSNSKRRRTMAPKPAEPRTSIDSATSDEFFDAEEAGADQPQLLAMGHQSDEENTPSEVDEADVHDESSESSDDDDDDKHAGRPENQGDCWPVKPKSLVPLPITDKVVRRNTIPPALVLPPSLIAFVRKNVGKDLSTISMPVSSNEPTSLLQRVAEQLEYANVLDAATKQSTEIHRLLYVTAFAVSQFSGSRAKERSIRKPFNPLLGETFELVRGENEVPGGLRLIVEKVTHRPVRLAMQADSALWSVSQSPAPAQKFWGKSAEITTEGRVRLVLRLPDGKEERYSWNTATVFLRNVVMGEKYVEPVGNDMHVINEDTGAKAVVEFRSKGMFGGRSEDVQVDTFGPDGSRTKLSLTGNWTSSLQIAEGGKPVGEPIWKAGSLVENAANTYGLTTFAATLNEITSVEKGRLPATDTRFRQDQRLAEEGKLDEAEEWKVKLEEGQRARRKVLEERGAEHKPRWFVKVATGGDGEEVWKLKGGKDGYWEERAKGQWSGVEEIFSV